MYIGCESIIFLHQCLFVSCDVTNSSNWERWSILPILSMKTMMMSWKSRGSFLSICNQNLKKPICQKSTLPLTNIFLYGKDGWSSESTSPARGKDVGLRYSCYPKVILVTFSTILFMWVPLQPIQMLQQTFNYPSKVVLSLLRHYLNKGYCVTLDNYYASPELGKPLMLNGTNCFGTLRKKSNLPDDFWLWKPKRGDPPKPWRGDWSNAFVSMMSTIHSFELVDSNTKGRHTGEVIKKPDVISDYNKTMGGVDLVSQVLIPYSSQGQGVKWYRKLAELYIDIIVYNSFIIYKKLNGGSKIDHFNFRKMLIEELIMFHASGGSSYSTSPNQIQVKGIL